MKMDEQPFRVVSDFEPAGDQPTAIASLSEGIRAGERFQTLARHHRVRQVGDDRVDDRAGAAADVDPRSQQEPRRPARAGDARVLPEQPGRVLRQLLRLLPARGVHPVERHLHREGLVDQRRDRSPAALGDGCAAHTPRRDRRRVGQLHLRHGQPRRVQGPAARHQRRRRLRHARHPAAARRHAVRPQRRRARARQVPRARRHDRGPPGLRRVGAADRAVRRHRRSAHPDRPAHGRDVAGAQAHAGLPGHALRHRATSAWRVRWRRSRTSCRSGSRSSTSRASCSRPSGCACARRTTSR